MVRLALAAFMAIIGVFVTLAVVGCSTTVPLSRLSTADPPMFCFEALVRIKGVARKARGCFEDEDTCLRALYTARNYGSMAGVEKLTGCSKR